MYFAKMRFHIVQNALIANVLFACQVIIDITRRYVLLAVNAHLDAMLALILEFAHLVLLLIISTETTTRASVHNRTARFVDMTHARNV